MKYTDRTTRKLQYKHQQYQLFNEVTLVKTYNKGQLKKFTPRIIKYVDPIWWGLISWEGKWNLYSQFRSSELTLEDFCKTIDPDTWVSKEDLREKKLRSLF